MPNIATATHQFDSFAGFIGLAAALLITLAVVAAIDFGNSITRGQS